MTLQRAQMISILRCAIVGGEGSFRLVLVHTGSLKKKLRKFQLMKINPSLDPVLTNQNQNWWSLCTKLGTCPRRHFQWIVGGFKLRPLNPKPPQ